MYRVTRVSSDYRWQEGEYRHRAAAVGAMRNAGAAVATITLRIGLAKGYRMHR
jgi:hypothetical protein